MKLLTLNCHSWQEENQVEKIKYLAVHAFKGSFSEEEISKWLAFFIKRFFSQQFKRSCIPDGPKVGTISISPRGDLRMPSDASVNMWIKDLEQIKACNN